MPRYRFTDRMDLIEEPSPKPVARSQDNVQHLHIWLDPPRIRDAANAPAEPGPTQGPDSELGEHLCTIRQDGRTGEWLGEDAEGNPVVVRGGPELRVFRRRGRGAVARQG